MRRLPPSCALCSLGFAREREQKRHRSPLERHGSPQPKRVQARGEVFKYSNKSAADGGGLWSFQTVARILKDPIYNGMMRQGPPMGHQL